MKYLRTTINGAKYYGLGKGFIFSLLGEGGYIFSFEGKKPAGVDKVRITDRFYLGEPQFRGFDIRGVGPRIQRVSYSDGTPAQTLLDDRNQIQDDALGGRAYYLGRAELEIPLGAGARELGLRPSIYVQVGSLFKVTRPEPTLVFPTLVDAATGKTYLGSRFTPVLDANGNNQYTYNDATGTPIVTSCPAGIPDASGTCNGNVANSLVQSEQTPFIERFLGNSAKPRVSIGAGVNWNSPFGPLRIDVARALVKQQGDDDKLITFNVGTQF